MYFKIALVILLSSTAVFFSREFGEAFKKTWSIPGVKLLLPLLVATGLFYDPQPWLIVTLLTIHDFFNFLFQEQLSIKVHS